jgi:hypothetical protein
MIGLRTTFQGFTLFLFVGIGAGKVIKKTATKPTDSSRYSSVAVFLASGNFISYGNSPAPARPTKRNSVKPRVIRCAYRWVVESLGAPVENREGN